jgi:hypothetical protein
MKLPNGIGPGPEMNYTIAHIYVDVFMGHGICMAKHFSDEYHVLNLHTFDSDDLNHSKGVRVCYSLD